MNRNRRMWHPRWHLADTLIIGSEPPIEFPVLEKQSASARPWPGALLSYDRGLTPDREDREIVGAGSATQKLG